MNKLLKYLGYAYILIIVIGCSKNIIIQRVDSNDPIIVRVGKGQTKVISGIKFPFILSIENSSFFKKKFMEIDYEYGYERQGAGIELYKDNQVVSNYNLKIIYGNRKVNYLVYSRHFTDILESTQDQLKPYFEKMLELNQDTLHIGTVAEFKEKHGELFKMLTENDTISIRFLKNKNSGLGERIAIPANW